MSKVFLKFWVEQSELMDWNEKNGGTFPQPFSRESVWLVVYDRKQKPLKSSFSTSFVLYLSLSVEGEGNVLPLEFYELSFAPDLQLVGARENVYKGWWGGNIQIFSLWGGGRRYSLLPWNITTGAVSESETSCLRSQYWCRCEKQEETKKNMVWQQEVFLITRKHYLPSFSLYLL